jgi:hypothetical protein
MTERPDVLHFLTDELFAELVANGRAQIDIGAEDTRPVCKLFNPTGGGTWLLSEIDPDYPTVAFGLCDLGFGSPELGSVDLVELAEYRDRRMGLPIERDLYFTPEKTLVEYANDAAGEGRITA